MVWAKALWTTAGGKNFPPFIIYEMLASALTAGALSTVASIFNHTIGEMLAQKLNYSKIGAGYTAAGASGGYNPDDPLNKNIGES